MECIFNKLLSNTPCFARLLLVKSLLLQHFHTRANQFPVFNFCRGAAITAACWVRFYRLLEREWHFIMIVMQDIILRRALVSPPVHVCAHATIITNIMRHRYSARNTNV